MNLAVVLVSDQTIPNVIYLKNLLKSGKVFDKVLFLTTEGMEKRSKCEIIAKAVGGDFCYEKVKVNQNMLFDVEKKLSDYFKDKEFDKIFVNITGGNKIMSLATYKFFDKFDDEKVEIVYLPIGSVNYKRIKPLRSDGKALDMPFEIKLSVDKYFEALGVKVERMGEPVNLELSKKLYNVYFEKKCIFSELTDTLRKYRKGDGSKEFKKPRNKEDVEKVNCLLSVLGLNPNEFDFFKDRTHIDYFSGGWFEEYVYDKIKSLKGECIDDIRLNVKLHEKSREVEDESEVKNELDVVFIANNNLHVVECKSGNLTSQDWTNTFYKVALLNRRFGLSARSYIVSLADNVFEFDKKQNKEVLKDNIQSKSSVFGVKFVDYKKVLSGLDSYFKEALSTNANR